MVVHPCSDGVSRVPPYSGYRSAARPFAYGTLTPYGWLSHTIRLKLAVLNAVQTPQVLLPTVWPTPLSLATTRGISIDVFSSPYLDVSVQAVPPIWLWIHHMVHGHDPMWVSPFGNPRIDRIFAPPRGLSQLITSFFGSQCQGIRPAPFLA